MMGHSMTSQRKRMPDLLSVTDMLRIFQKYIDFVLSQTEEDINESRLQEVVLFFYRHRN